MFGFEQRDLSGNLLVSITTRLPRIIGRVTVTAGQAGSVVVPASGTNPAFFIFQPDLAAPDFNVSPQFTDNNAATNPSATIWSGGARSRGGR